jgi:hypothetical protein
MLPLRIHKCIVLLYITWLCGMELELHTVVTLMKMVF